jgi:hypothetical protein
MSVQGPSRHFDRALSTSALPLEQASAAPVGMSQTSDIRQRTGQSRKFDGLRVPNF